MLKWCSISENHTYVIVPNTWRFKKSKPSLFWSSFSQTKTKISKTDVVPWDGWIGTGMYGSPGASKSILAQPQGIILLDLVTPEGEKRRCFQKSSIAKICLTEKSRVQPEFWGNYMDVKYMIWILTPSIIFGPCCELARPIKSLWYFHDLVVVGSPDWWMVLNFSIIGEWRPLHQRHAMSSLEMQFMMDWTELSTRILFGSFFQERFQKFLVFTLLTQSPIEIGHPWHDMLL